MSKLIRPKTSVPRTLQSASKYSHLPLSRQAFSYAGSSFTPISSKFTRRKFKEDYANSETAYNTRNGVLNSSSQLKRPGGNGYFSILRQKVQIAEVMSQETALDRRIRDLKMDLIDNRKLPLDQSFSTVSGDLRPSTFITAPKKTSHSRLSSSFSATPLQVKVETSPAKYSIPASFSNAAIRCVCSVTEPCLCGKRDLTVAECISSHAEKINDILGSCNTVSKEAAEISEELVKNLKTAKVRLKVCHRHTKTIMMGIQRAKYFSLRRKFQLATRRHEQFQNSTQICIPADIEEAAESDPSIFVSDSAVRHDRFSR